MNFCTKCGNQLNPNARFCSKCGQVVTMQASPLPSEPETTGKCSQCGNSLHHGSKFCVNCGKPVTLVPEFRPQVEKGKSFSTGFSRSGNKQKPQNKPGLMNFRYAKPAAITFLFVVIMAVGYLFLKPGAHKLVKELLYTKMLKPSDSTIVIPFDSQLSVGIPFGELDKEREMRISKVSGFPESADELKVGNAFEVVLDGRTEFESYIEIEMKYDPAQFPSNANADNGVMCMYYDEKMGAWEPIAHEIDHGAGSAKVYTNHLSVFGVVQDAQTVQAGPRMKLPSPKFPSGNLMSQEQMVQILRKNTTQPNETAEGLKEGWDVFLDRYGLTGVGFDFVENVMEMDQVSEVNGILGNLGLGFALAQAALDMANDNQAEAVLGLTKEFVNTGIKNVIFQTRTMNIAMIGVFAIDYTLNDFAETAVSGRNEIYEKAYRKYYKERKIQNKENIVWWNKKLKKLINNINDPKQINEQIDKALNDYVWYFWSDEQLVAQYQEQVSGHAWTAGGGLSEKVKTEIAEVHLCELRQTLDVVFKKLIKDMRLEYLGKLHENMAKATKKLNQEHTIIVRIKKDPNSEAYQYLSLGGLDVNIEATNPDHKGLWKGKTDGNGEFALVCSLLGYVHAGSPKTVTVEIPGPTEQSPKQTFQGNLTLSKTAKTTKVEIVIGGSADVDLGGTWSVEGVCTAAQYQPGSLFKRIGYTEAESEALRIEEQNAMIGKTHFIGEVQFVPDYQNLNTYETYTEGGFNVVKIISSGNGMVSTYRIRLTSNSTIEGTLERIGIGGLSNEKYNIKAKRIRE